MLQGSSDLYLRVDGIKGQWASYADHVLIPNIAVGPNLPSEESRVASELYKLLWDYRTKREGMAVPDGKKSPNGLYHDFPWEPTIPATEATFFKEARQSSLSPAEVEALQATEPIPEIKPAPKVESMFEDSPQEPKVKVKVSNSSVTESFFNVFVECQD